MAGGCFPVAAAAQGHIAGIAGFRPVPGHVGRLEALRVRVHPARRRQGIGRTLMTALEERGRELGFYEACLDTATNQPEAMAFCQGAGYTLTGCASRPCWDRAPAYFLKNLH